MLLNPDTVVPAGTIGRAVAELAARPRVGMLGCKLVRPDGSFDHACKRGFPTVLSALYYFTGLAGRFPGSPRFAQYTAAHLGIDETGRVDAINGAFMLVRRAAIDEVGDLDERYWLWAEDLDWCHRFWENDWGVLYWPEVEVVHHKSASVGEHRSLRLNFAFHRSIWLFYKKHHAPHRSAVLSALVAFGVWSKFVGSAVANAVARAAPRWQARSGPHVTPAASSVSCSRVVPTVQILGIPIACLTIDEAVERALDGGLVLAPSGPGLCDLERDPDYRDALLGSDVNLTDSGLVVLVEALRYRRKLPRASGLGYIEALLARARSSAQAARSGSCRRRRRLPATSRGFVHTGSK